MKKLIALLSIVLVSVLSGITFGHVLNVNPVIPGIISFVGSFIPMPAGSLYSLVWTSPAAIGPAAFNLSYIPQFIIYNAGAAPLTNLRVEDAIDGVICDLPAAGILQVRNYMRYGLVASPVTAIRLANGHIPGKNITVTATIAAAAAVPFQVCSDCPGNTALKYVTAALLAGVPTPFQDFFCLFLPGLAPGDTVLVEFSNGHTQLFNEVELLELTAKYQNNQLATGFELNNIDNYIHKATVTEAILGAAYVMSANLKK